MSTPDKESAKSSGIFPNVRRYLDYRLEEVKLQSAKGLSDGMSVVTAVFIAVLLLLNALLLLSISFMEWLNGVLGLPWGTVIMLTFLILLAVIFFHFRNFFFRKAFRKLFSSAFNLKSENLDSDIRKASYYADIEEQRITRPVHKVAGFLLNSRNIIGFAATAATVIGSVSKFAGIFRKKSK